MIDERMPIVCTKCGGRITPIKTVDNSGVPTHWAGCKRCMVFNHGTSPKIFEIARKIVDNVGLWLVDEMRPHKEDELKYAYWHGLQVNRAVEVVSMVFDLMDVEK